MKHLTIIVFIFLTLSSSLLAQTNTDHVWVSGYFKGNKFVQGHFRTAPNSTVNDNFSTIGNVNPYTGEAGTVARDNGANIYNNGSGNYVRTNKSISYSNEDYFVLRSYKTHSTFNPGNSSVYKNFNYRFKTLTLPNEYSSSTKYESFFREVIFRKEFVHIVLSVNDQAIKIPYSEFSIKQHCTTYYLELNEENLKILFRYDIQDGLIASVVNIYSEDSDANSNFIIRDIFNLGYYRENTSLMLYNNCK
ncbi:hypothetical protein CLV84_4335 [Neolewinella xylanilytica]|uniref:Uncharacterized protein n=1 Tax=Neolewinella xylanilytica TaxID=1514080 RepID=A0A2S6HZN4_9BACT|nr:hypothetical protein [Neolewinella xylanilytica]PPK83789.1 hypothetical protein CLV84_4335 [Neolewinella xylanilytica]